MTYNIGLFEQLQNRKPNQYVNFYDPHPRLATARNRLINSRNDSICEQLTLYSRHRNRCRCTMNRFPLKFTIHPQYSRAQTLKRYKNKSSCDRINNAHNILLMIHSEFIKRRSKTCECFNMGVKQLRHFVYFELVSFGFVKWIDFKRSREQTFVKQ